MSNSQKIRITKHSEGNGQDNIPYVTYRYITPIYDLRIDISSPPNYSVLRPYLVTLFTKFSEFYNGSTTVRKTFVYPNSNSSIFQKGSRFYRKEINVNCYDGYNKTLKKPIRGIDIDFN